MPIIRPRLNDYYGLPFTQEEVDFAIPFLDEDIPFYVDPFLLWKSPSQQDNSLHLSVVNGLNYLGHRFLKGDDREAIGTLIRLSECNEVGLGVSKTRIGKPIGEKVAFEVLSLYKDIPKIGRSGFIHVEEIQLLVDNIAKDRISDFTCSFIKSFLIDFTVEQCRKLGIPLEKKRIGTIYDQQKNKLIEEEVYLPKNPVNELPVILVPKRWLRYIPWINYEDYFKSYVSESDKPTKDRVGVLNYNRYNYDVVQAYVEVKERQRGDCRNDPLFKPIPVLSTKRKLSTILKLPTGREDSADKKYEENISQIMASLLYPQLDFADIQSRTESGVLIRDLIFYNNRSHAFLKEIYEKYDSHQIVFELKNVNVLNNENISQLNRYLKEQFGRFGIIVTRKKPPRPVFKNTIDLWSGQRKVILILDDEDIELMCLLYESRQRDPIDVLKKAYVEFTRACPS